MNLSDTWDANIIGLGEGLYNAVKKKNNAIMDTFDVSSLINTGRIVHSIVNTGKINFGGEWNMITKNFFKQPKNEILLNI